MIPEIKLLINGYEIYPKEIEKGTKSKTSICNFIEKEVCRNKTVNVRQEFNRYDSYFEAFENSNSEFDKTPTKLKIELLQ